MRRERPALAVGTSVSISHVARLSGARAVVFNEDDIDYIPLFAALAYPFAHAICTPEGVRVGRWHAKQVTYPGYHELAYLHPDVFTPDTTVREAMGLGDKEVYSLVRLSALAAHHDRKQLGISEEQLQQLVSLLRQFGRVFISSEKVLPSWAACHRLDVGAGRMHDVLAGASCLVSDSQTMTMEAAVLGTPAFRCNTFVGRCSVIEELEHRYELTRGFAPGQFGGMLDEVGHLLKQADPRAAREVRRRQMLAEKINVADWIYTFLAESLHC